MNWPSRNWYGLASCLFLALAIIDLIHGGESANFWAKMILCFICQAAQAILYEIRKSKA